MDPRLVSDIQQAEGCRLVAYRDSLGFWTIGYGHRLQQNIDWTGHTITQATADSLLASDLQYAQETAEYLPEWSCLDTQCRQNSVVELVFNMGSGTWRMFAKCRYDIQQGDWQGAHDELLNSKWATQVGPTRSERLATYLLTGNYN